MYQHPDLYDNVIGIKWPPAIKDLTAKCDGIEAASFWSRGQGATPLEACKNWRDDVLKALGQGTGAWVHWHVPPNIQAHQKHPTMETEWEVLSYFTVPLC
jgi:hypothetical protein